MREAYEFSNAVRQQAEAVMSRKPKSRMATVNAYNPAAHAVKVLYQPEGTESAWMPLAALGVGSGFGVLVGPNFGDQVEVEFTDGDYAAPKATARFFSAAAQPPTVPAGEIWLVHQLGAVIKLTNDGKLTATDKAGSTITLNGDGTGTATFSGLLTVNANTQINGTLKVSGDITDNSGTNSRTMAGMRQVYNTHTHPVTGVQTGLSTVTSNQPNQQE